MPQRLGQIPMDANPGQFYTPMMSRSLGYQSGGSPVVMGRRPEEEYPEGQMINDQEMSLTGIRPTRSLSDGFLRRSSKSTNGIPISFRKRQISYETPGIEILTVQK